VVEGDNKGRGYQLKRGSYVEIEPEELEAVEIEMKRGGFLSCGRGSSDYFGRKRRRSMQCFASATASSFSGALVERVDRDMMGKSARLAYMPVHQLDHCHMGTISYPRYW
jgi:hypothetical protein